MALGESLQRTERTQTASVVVVVFGEGASLLLPRAVLLFTFSPGFCAFGEFHVGRREALGPALRLHGHRPPSGSSGAHLLPLPFRLYFWSISLEMHTPLSAKLQVSAWTSQSCMQGRDGGRVAAEQGGATRVGARA